ncbi:hypothetical protein F5Y19DRAFT_474476 [Xylariaceae sp. FL1651]|nr:hypothetical protein F5Y19DRAFT_474476 [Xylariaceae sp. FL1651]
MGYLQMRAPKCSIRLPQRLHIATNDPKKSVHCYVFKSVGYMVKIFTKLKSDYQKHGAFDQQSPHWAPITASSNSSSSSTPRRRRRAEAQTSSMRADAFCLEISNLVTATSQTTMPDPFLPLTYTTTDNAGGSTSFAQDVMTGKGKNRIQTPEEWYRCRQPEIMQMLQEYHDAQREHGQHRGDGRGQDRQVQRDAVSALGRDKRQARARRHQYRRHANQPYLQAGIAIVGFNYTRVAVDSNAKTGAFWDVYNGRDIGVLTAWAWGFHRVLDALNATVPEVDSTRAGATGCSRLGKGALAAGLFDARIALTMPMSSGVQGLGPYRYHAMSGQDETLENSKAGAPWWSDGALGTFVGHAENLPYDAHTVAAALAPRALVIDQGTGDQFTNSKATAVVVYPAAKVVYDFLGAGDKIAMSVRSGAHCDMSGYSSVLPFVTHILQNVTLTNYNDLGSYGAPMTTTYPWATAVPKPA